MHNLNNYIEILGQIREQDEKGDSIASRGFNTSLPAWLSCPQDLDRSKVLSLALVYNLGSFAEKLAIETEEPFIQSLYAEVHTSAAPEADFVRWINKSGSRGNYPEAESYIDRHRSELLKITEGLNNLKRSGWIMRKVCQPESVAEHSYTVALQSFIFGSDSKMTGIGLIHDLQETKVGDYTPYDEITPEKKAELELKAARDISKKLELSANA